MQVCAFVRHFPLNRGLTLGSSSGEMTGDMAVRSKENFIHQLAVFLVSDQEAMSIRLEMGLEDGKHWRDLRATTPLVGWPTVEEAEKQLCAWFDTGVQLMEGSMSYPEHEKLRAIGAKSQACGEFLDWLLGPQHYVFAEYHTHSEECVVDGEKVCCMAKDSLHPAPVNVRKLLAQFFSIDEEKLENEKRAMLRDLQHR